MSITKRNANLLFPSIPSVVDSFFGDEFFTRSSDIVKMPAVNVKEETDKFCVDLVAPGCKKSDFNLKVDNGRLFISSESNQESEEETEKFTRKEYSHQSFQRSFSLPENTNEDEISAKYEDGILKIEIPKKEVVAKTQSKFIEIS